MSIRRIYIDSKHRASGTPSSFSYQLPRSIETPDETVCYVDSVFLPNVWGTFNADNNKLYVVEHATGGTEVKRLLLLEIGNYSSLELANAIETHLNLSKTLANDYSVTYIERTGKFQIVNSSPGTWYLATRTQLKDPAGFWAGQVITDPKDCYSVIGFMGTEVVSSGTLSLTGYVQLQPYKTLFLCSSSFGNPNQSIGPVSQSDIIRRIVVAAPFGNYVHDQHSTQADYVDCSLCQLDNLSFRLTDSEGHTVDLHGHSISFSLCFVNKAVV